MTADPEFATHLPEIMKNPDSFDFSQWFQPLSEMLKNRVLLTQEDEDDFMITMKFRKTASRFDSSTMGLTLLVTEKCNFKCPYCFEKINDPADMSDEVIDGLIRFIETFMPLKSIFITWFGGEPLLRPDIIRKVNQRIMDLGVKVSSLIVTNGWLLNDQVIDMLDELNATAIQVTIEGPPEIHNQTRIHKSRGDSFHVIQQNLDRLMLERKWKGSLIIHYNIDDYNADHYAETIEYWKNRYPDGRVLTGKNFVDRDKRGSRDGSCSFSREREIEYYLTQYRKNGGMGLSYYPVRHGFGCIATKRNGFVIGARGQVYKCWHDVGVEDRQIGSVFTPPQKWNWSIISRYMSGVDPFDNPECRECFLLPVCEDCPHIWYRKKYMGQDVSLCARYRENLARFLEIHYERKQVEEGKC
jgi:uncharacterized protein